MKQLLKYLQKMGKSADLAEIGKKALDGAKSAKTAVKAGGQYAATEGAKVFKKFPKAGSAAAGAAVGAGAMAAADDDDADDMPKKKKKKRAYLDD